MSQVVLVPHPSSPTPAHSLTAPIHEKGKTLCDRAEVLYHRSRLLIPALEQIQHSPARAACSFTTLAAGVLSCTQGDLLMGVPMALCGAKEVWNLTRSPDDSNLQRSLKNIQADAGMITTLLEANHESYQIMQTHLSDIRSGVLELHAQLNQISAISHNASDEIEMKRQEALAVNQQAVLAFEKACRLFETAQDQLKESSIYYHRCGESFERIGQIVGNDDPAISLEEKIHKLVEVSRDAATSCRSGKQHLDQTAEALSQAMKALSDAHQLRDQATLVFGQTLQLAQDTLRHVQETAQITDQCQERIAATELELQRVQHRSEQIMRLIEDLKQEVIRAQEEAQGRLGVSEVAVGVTVGTLCAPLGTASIPIGVAAAYTYHNSSALYQGARSVYHWVYGMKAPKPPAMQAEQLIRHRFDETSSGWMGYLKRRPSKTLGTLDLNLGDEVFTVRFDLNQSHKISRLEMLGVFEVMNHKVSTGKMDPRRCLRILDELESCTIDRGALHPRATGLIQRSQASYAVFELLRDVCSERLRLQQTT